MQENRSFDHYFGTMRGVRGYGDPHPAMLPQRQVGLAPAPGKHLTRRCCPSGPTSTTSAWPSSRTSTTAGTTSTTPSTHGNHDRWVPAKGTPVTMAHLRRERHPLPLRPGRRLHGLRRLPLLHARPDRPQPLLHVDRLGRQRRQGRRPGHQQRRGRLRLDDLPRAAAEGRGLLEDLPGRRRRARRRAHSWGFDSSTPYIGNYGDNSLLYFDQYQNAAPGEPALRARPAPAPTCRRRARSSTSSARRRRTGTLPQVSWIVAPEAFTEHPNWPAELRRLVRRARSSTR